MNVQTVSFQKLSFINVTKPTDFEIKYLKNTYFFNPLDLEDYAYRTQIPKIESHKEYDLIVLRFPLFSENVPQNLHQYGVHFPAFYPRSKKRRLISSYVNFFISKEYVVILHDGTLLQINKVFALCQKNLHNRTEYMGRGAAYLAYKIINALTDDCFPVVNELTSTIDEIDKELEDKQTRKTLESISATRRNLVVLHTLIKPILPLFSELENGKHERLNGLMQPYWGNTLDHLQKIMDRVEDNRELIEGISESNESILTARTNDVVKILTMLTVLPLPPIIIASLYGMNIELPFAEYKYVFYVIMAVTVILCSFMLIVFRLWRWF